MNILSISNQIRLLQDDLYHGGDAYCKKRGQSWTSKVPLRHVGSSILYQSIEFEFKAANADRQMPRKQKRSTSQ